MTTLQVQGLVKSFGSRRVVDGVDFQVEPEEIVVLLGPNGAGKSTSFGMTCGLIEPDEGRVYLNGQDVTKWPMYRRCGAGGMGYLPQKESVFRQLTVEQNLLGVMELLGHSAAQRKRRCDELLDQFGITHIRESKAASVSGGERRRLEIARCLITEPDIILLDEPFPGIDPVTVQQIQGTIKSLKELGIAVLITDHNVSQTLEIADRGYVIVKGKVLCAGSPREIVANPRAREVYFGTGIKFDFDPNKSEEDGNRPRADPPRTGPPAPHAPDDDMSNSRPNRPRRRRTNDLR